MKKFYSTFLYFLNQLKLRDKMLFLIMSIIFISITLFYSVSYTIYLHSVKLKAQTYSVNMISQMIKNTDSYFKGIESIALSLAYNPIIQNTAVSTSLNENYESVKEAKYIDNALKLFVFASKNLQISIFLENNTNSFYTLYTSINPGYNFKGDDWYKIASNSKDKKIILLNNPQNYFVENDRRPVYTMIYKINSMFTQDTLGYILMDIDKNQFETFFKNEYLDIENSIILDENNNIIYSYPENPFLSKITEDMPKGQQWGYFNKTINGKEYMAIFGTSEYSKWKIVNILPYKTLLKDVDNIKVLFLLIAVSLFIITIFISFRFSAAITNPMVQLTQGMEKIKSGEFQFSIPSTSADEIGLVIQNFNSMTRQIDILIKQNETTELLKKESELKSLQQQINPHFLYNTLEIVIGLASEKEYEKIIAVCKNLGNMFRYNLGNQKIVSIRDELNQIKSYTRILEYRFDGKFKVEYMVNPDLYEYKIVKFILQPFVENSISHGFRNTLSGGLLSVKADWFGERIQFAISDNGSGISKEDLESINSTLLHYEENTFGKNDIPPHLGIINVFMRLKLLFSDNFSLSIHSELNRGTTVKIEFPPITQIES